MGFRLDMIVTMPRSTLVLGLAVLFACALGAQAAPGATPYPNTNGFGIDFDGDEDWHRQCMRVAHLAPARTGPHAPEARRSRALDLYYLKRDQTATTPGEWRQVRETARAAGNDAVLMMLYANGYGVARDTDRAIYHACRLDTAKAEMEGRVAHLASGAAAFDSQPFDLCDHITSGRMGAVCAGIDETRAGRARTARLERLAAALPSPARAPFARLRKAAAVFAKQSLREADMTGTAAAAVAIRRRGRREDEFLEAVLATAQGKLKRANAAELAQLERQLDARYRQALAKPSAQEGHPERIAYSTVTRDDLRASQRAWLAYRDAWSPYLAAARAPADLTSLRVLLTRQRIVQLSRFHP